MPLFVCDICGCVENTALGFYWSKTIAEREKWFEDEFLGKAMCCECTPKTTKDGEKLDEGYGEWHGRFQKKSWKEWDYCDVSNRTTDDMMKELDEYIKPMKACVHPEPDITTEGIIFGIVGLRAGKTLLSDAASIAPVNGGFHRFPTWLFTRLLVDCMDGLEALSTPFLKTDGPIMGLVIIYKEEGSKDYYAKIGQDIWFKCNRPDKFEELLKLMDRGN